MQVDNNGNVGIGTGTNAPAAGLQIANGVGITNMPVLFEVQNGEKGWTNIQEAASLAVNGNLLAVGSLTGVTIASLTNPAAPAVLSQIVQGTGGFTNFTFITEVAWAGSNLIATAWGATDTDTRALNIIGCTNPASPVKLAELRAQGVNGWNNLGAVTALAVSGNLLAIGVEPDTSTNFDAVTFADISNPSAPVEKNVILNGSGGFTNLFAINSLVFMGNVLVIGSERGVTLADVSNPLNPIKLAELVVGAGAYTNWQDVAGISLSGNVLAVTSFSYPAGQSVVTLVDLSNPANPVKLADIQDGVGGFAIDGADSAALAGNRLVISAEYSDTLTLVDVEGNPANPVRLVTDLAGVNGADYIFGAEGEFLRVPTW